MLKLPEASIGVFGGSGFYSLLENGKELDIKTPYGKPSDKIFIGQLDGKSVVFLPRHGKRHQFPPHEIPYRANLYAFKMLGVNTVIAPIAVGSLKARIKPGDFVLCDQFVNKTYGRADTYFEGGKTKNKFSPILPRLLGLAQGESRAGGRGRAKAKVVHISSADSYCFDLRQLALKTAKRLKIKIHPKGTVVVINGPRFSSKSESEYFQRQRWEVVNMTQYPECVLAKELEMCYLGIALVTDYDAGLLGQKGIKPVTINEVIRVFNSSNERVKKLIFEIIRQLPGLRVCGCHNSLKEAIIS